MNKGCLYAAAGLLLIITAGVGYYFYSQNQSDPVKYESIKPEIKKIQKKAVATGSIIPRKEVNIKPQVSGVVENLFVEAGEQVSKGQKIAKIKLIPSEVNINNAKSNVELARIRLKESQRNLSRQTDINTKQLDIDQAKANFDLAVEDEKRQKSLLDGGTISQREYNQIKVDLELKKSIYENTKITADNSIKSLDADVDIRKQELAAAQNNLQLLREGATKNSRQVSNIITSTVDGMILDVPVEEGSSVIERNNFNEGSNVAIIADMNSLIFEGKVDESDVDKLREGMPLVVTVGAILDTNFAAILEFIAPKGELEEGSVKFKIKAAIKEVPADVFLRAGYSANADVILQQKDNVVAIQERDVIYKGDTTLVEIETGEQEFEEKEVELGLSDGLYVEVTSGIDTTTLIKKRIDPNAGKAE